MQVGASASEELLIYGGRLERRLGAIYSYTWGTGIIDQTAVSSARVCVCVSKGIKVLAFIE